jgi:hypothetical protein
MKRVITLLLVLGFFIGALIIVGLDVKAAPQVEFQPISMGDLLWLSTLSKGEVITVSYLQQNGYNYAQITYTDNLGTTSTDLMLPDKPVSITISGCNHYLTIISGMSYIGNKPLYMAQVEVKSNIPCLQSSTVSLPLVTK